MSAIRLSLANPAQDRSPAALQHGWAVRLQAAGELRIKLTGRWVLASGACTSGEISRCLETTPPAAIISFDVQDLGPWDNVLIDFLNKIERIAGERGISIDRSALPGGVARLLALARAVPEHRDARRVHSQPDPLTRIGAATQTFLAATADFVGFVGETSAAVGRLILAKARFRGSDFLLAIEDCGPGALPIAALVSFLVGLILAFVGAIELRQFGASIYVANLVGVAMAHERVLSAR